MICIPRLDVIAFLHKIHRRFTTRTPDAGIGAAPEQRQCCGQIASTYRTVKSRKSLLVSRVGVGTVAQEYRDKLRLVIGCGNL